MQLLELPLDIFRIIIRCTIKELGLDKSMKARATCRTFSNEILDAVIATRVIEDVAEYVHWNIDYHPAVTARYLYHRVRTDRPDTHSWITAIRETSRMLAKTSGLETDPACLELMERSACLCLAANKGRDVFEVLCETPYRNISQGENSTLSNCLAVAAWMGDESLVASFHRGSDPLTLFGTPSWAAAVQGHYHLLESFLNHGALPYESTSNTGPRFPLYKTTLGAAAYMGRDRIVQLLLQQPYYLTPEPRNIATAVTYAAQGNQSTTLKILLEYHKSKATSRDFTGAIDCALLRCCQRGAFVSAQILLDYGADVNETDPIPRSCLQWAAISGNAPLVKILLDAGASIEAPSKTHHRSCGIYEDRRPRNDALTEARLRDHIEVAQLIEKKGLELTRST